MNQKGMEFWTTCKCRKVACFEAKDVVFTPTGAENYPSISHVQLLYTGVKLTKNGGDFRILKSPNFLVYFPPSVLGEK